YLDTVKSFADVPITDAGVDTATFLEASQGLSKMFDLLGSTAFAVVQSDINGNIAKVRARYDAEPSKSATLEELVKNEQGEKKRTATEGLLWLLRGLSFTRLALQNSYDVKSEELNASFSKSYDSTLKKHHNFVVKGIFAVAMKACPYRATFYSKLYGETPAEVAEPQLGAWLAALKNITTRMDAFYEKGGYGKGF
ncbi:glycolipid transfer protein, partial [Sistotremastrum suecicum HHB10207 ss-3]